MTEHENDIVIEASIRARLTQFEETGSFMLLNREEALALVRQLDCIRKDANSALWTLLPLTSG
jgi:hypothetical protein